MRLGRYGSLWCLIHSVGCHVLSIRSLLLVKVADFLRRCDLLGDFLGRCHLLWLWLRVPDAAASCTMEAKLAFQVINSENHITGLQPIRRVELLDDCD